MRNDSTTAVPSHSLGSTALALAGSIIGLHRRKNVVQDGGTLEQLPTLAAALACIAVLILGLLAIFALLIFCLPAIVHLVVE